MEKPNFEPKFDPEVLRGRMPCSPEDFLEQMAKLCPQDRCPWGDLSEMNFGMFSRNPVNVPLALEVGSGGMASYSIVDQLAENGFWLANYIASNVYIPSDFESGTAACMSMDLTDPSQITLGGLKVPFLVSRMIFTGDGAGVEWPSPEVKAASCEALCKLIIPGGVICFLNIYPSDFDFRVLRKFSPRPLSFKDSLGIWAYQIG
jgi:hypothetical protein